MSDFFSKVDARGRRQLRRGGAIAGIEVLIMTFEPVAERELAAIADCRFRVDSANLNIVSASGSSSDLQALAELPFVRKIELSRVLAEE